MGLSGRVASFFLCPGVNTEHRRGSDGVGRGALLKSADRHGELGQVKLVNGHMPLSGYADSGWEETRL